MVFNSVKLLNLFPVKGGLPYSTKSIMAGEIVKYDQYSLPFGTYRQVQEFDEPRNSMAARTQVAICLGGKGNDQCGYSILYVNTGQVVTRYSYTILSMPQSVIDRVNVSGEGQPSGISFHDCLGQEVGDSDDNFESSDDQNNITGVYDAPDQENDGLTCEFDNASDSNVIESEVEVQTHANSVEVKQFDPSFEHDQEIVVSYAEELVVLEPSVDEQVELRRSSRER